MIGSEQDDERFGALFGLVGLALLLSGCINYEVNSYRIELTPSGKDCPVVTEFRNISSDLGESAKAEDDFEELIRQWKSAEIVAEQAKRGIQIKNREVWIEDGQIMARLTAAVANIRSLEDLKEEKDEWVYYLGNDISSIKTNGTAYEEEENDLKRIRHQWNYLDGFCYS